jgi:hypothetical protein
MMSSEETSASEGVRERPCQIILNYSPSKAPLATPRVWPSEDEVIPDSEDELMNESVLAVVSHDGY